MPRKAMLPNLLAANRSKFFLSAIGLALFAASFLSCGISTANAAIVTSGGVYPTNPAFWTSSTVCHIGWSTAGSIIVNGGSNLSSSVSYLGYESDSIGKATVTDFGSKWTNNGELQIGASGSGTLTITAGGTVSSTSSYIGYNAGSTGLATVVYGGTWTNSSDLYIGCSGNGALNIADGSTVVVGETTWIASNAGSSGALNFGAGGGTLTTESFCAAPSQVSGAGTISTHGLVSDVNLVFDSAATLKQTITWRSPAGETANINLDLTSDPTNSCILGAGYLGNGSLLISRGTVVNSQSGYLGYHNGSTGTVTVDGNGSHWSNAADLYVGVSGSGALSINGGAAVTVGGSLWVAQYPGSSGIINFGAGGGSLTTGSLLASSTNVLGTGTVTARGLVSDVDLVLNSAASLKRTIVWQDRPGQNVTINLDLSSDPAVNGYLGAGFAGNGSLIVSQGMEVRSKGGRLGCRSGSTGLATVSGAGSTWSNSDRLDVGYSGVGTLNIEAGGQVSNTFGYLGYFAGSTGTVSVKGNGSTWSNSDRLHVGYSGVGTLTIAEGAQVSNTVCWLGSTVDGAGTAAVSGKNSKWTSSYFEIGYLGAGSLNVNSGGAVESHTGSLGYGQGSHGTATITGVGSIWSMDSLLTLGYTGNGCGTLNIEAGGQVSNTGGYVGYAQAAIGTVTVTGAGSQWTNISDLRIGFFGNGRLTIAEGAQVTNLLGYLGDYPGSSGTVTVTGSGSKWTNSSGLCIGMSGSGKLNIEAGGQVTSTYGSLGSGSNSTGTATVTGPGSIWTCSSGLSVGAVGSGTLTIEAAGQVTSLSGNLGKLTNSIGTVIVSGMGSKWIDSDYLYVGDNGKGTLTIKAGGQVTNTTGYLGCGSGSAGTAIVTGIGSTWTNSSTLYVGHSYAGTLTVEAGGQVSNTTGYLGFSIAATGIATVTGTGSRWSNSSYLYVGSSGTGKLNIADGGTVTASDVSINSKSLLSIDVGNDSLLTIGSGGAGTITNKGKVRIIAGSGSIAGHDYSPIAARTWSGTGAYQAIGGTWDTTTHVFTASEILSGASGTSIDVDLAQRQRVLITEGEHGWSVGASLLAKTGAATQVNFTATAIGGDTLASLETAIGAEQTVLGGWEFAATGNGYAASDPVYLSFDVGGGLSSQDLQVWHYNGAWTKYAPADLTYDGTNASFTVTSFSGYAVAAPVPEPSSMLLLASALLGLLGYGVRRRSK